VWDLATGKQAFALLKHGAPAEAVARALEAVRPYIQSHGGDVDVLAVQDAMKTATKLAREQHEPSLVEAVSFRFRGHSVVDPDRYRDPEEVQQGRAHDPITAFAARLTQAGFLDENAVREIEDRMQQEVDAAVTFAEESPFASVEEFMGNLYEYVYAPDGASVKGL